MTRPLPIMTQQCAFMTHGLLSEGIALPHILYFRQYPERLSRYSVRQETGTHPRLRSPEQPRLPRIAPEILTPDSVYVPTVPLVGDYPVVEHDNTRMSPQHGLERRSIDVVARNRRAFPERMDAVSLQGFGRDADDMRPSCNARSTSRSKRSSHLRPMRSKRVTQIK